MTPSPPACGCVHLPTARSYGEACDRQFRDHVVKSRQWPRQWPGATFRTRAPIFPTRRLPPHCPQYSNHRDHRAVGSATDLDIDTHQLRQHDAGPFHRRLHPGSLHQPGDRPKPRRECGQLDRIRNLRDRAFADHRRHPRLAHRTDRCAVERPCLCHDNCFAGNTLHPLCHGLALPAGASRAVQRSLSHMDRSDIDTVQCQQPDRNDTDRGVPLVAAGLPAAIIDISCRKCRHGGGSADVRRVHSRHDSADFDEACPSGAVCARAVCFHTKHRGIRGPRSGRDARPGRCPDNGALQKHQGSSHLASVTQVRFRLSC